MSSSSELLLTEVAYKLGILREAKRKFSDRLAPEFSFFDYLRKDEVGLSKCFAGILEPRGSHGQGSVFLQEFFNLVVGQKYWTSDFEDCEISLEKQAYDQRRIDIYLQFKESIVGIENKPWAEDQDNQLTDYAAYLNKKAAAEGKEKWLLIYLSDRDPSEKSLNKQKQEELERNKHFVKFSFSQLEDWLEACIRVTKALQVRIFIEELQKFVRMRIRGELDMSEEKEISGIITDSTRNIEAAFDVFNAIEAAKIQLLAQFERELREGLEKEGFQLVWDMNKSGRRAADSFFGVKFCPDHEIYLAFDFENSNLNGLFWGLRRTDETIKAESTRWENISNRMTPKFGEGDSTAWWPWWQSDTKVIFDSQINDWSQNAKPWSLLKNGLKNEESVASRIVWLAKEVKQAMGDQLPELFAKSPVVLLTAQKGVDAKFAAE